MSEIEKAVWLLHGIIKDHNTGEVLEIDSCSKGIPAAVKYLERMQQENTKCRTLLISPEIIRILASWPEDGYGPEIRAVLEAAREAVA